MSVVTTTGIQGEKDAATGCAWPCAANDALAGVVQKATALWRFRRPPLQDAAADELQRAITQLGFKGGALINGQTNGHYLMMIASCPSERGADAPVLSRRGFPPSPRCSPAGRNSMPVWRWRTTDSALPGVRWHVPAPALRSSSVTWAKPRPAVALDSRYQLQMASSRRAQRPSVSAPQLHHHVGRRSRPLQCDPRDGRRSLFSVDYPYEDSQVAAEFIDGAPISDDVRAGICRGNAQRLLRL
jgi:2,3-dihydroxybenzoate decarboxylase